MMIWLLITSTLLGTAGAVSGITGPDGPVVGLVGDDLQLPCHVKSGNSAVDEEIIWKRGDKMVHHYLRHTDRTDQQPPEYRGRTSVSRVALQRGDVSLTLTNLRLSDAGTYKCIVRADTWFDEAPVAVTVEAVGSTPSVSAVSLGDGRVRLQCESEGWSTEPQLQWLDSRGQQIAADPISFQRLQSGLRVTSIITVEETEGSNFACLMTSAVQRREQTIKVLKGEFGTKRERHGMTAALGVLGALVLAIALLMAIKDTFLIPDGGAVLEEVWCVFQKKEVCVYRQGHLEVSDGYKGAVSSDTHTLPSGGIRLTLTMTKDWVCMGR